MHESIIGTLVIFTMVMIGKNKSKRVNILTKHYITKEDATKLVEEVRAANTTESMMLPTDMYAMWTASAEMI